MKKLREANIRNHNRLKRSLAYRCLRIFSRRDLLKLGAVAGIQVVLSLLDLAGVAVIGILGALSVRGIQQSGPGDRVSSLLEILGLSGRQFQEQIAVLGLLAAVFLVSRTILSIFLTRRTLYFLSRRAGEISSRMVALLMKQDLLKVQEKNSQETLFALTGGVGTVAIGVVGSAVSFVADISLLTVLSAGLFVVDSKIALGTYLLFGGIGISLYFLLHRRARNLGIRSSELQIESNKLILEAILGYRDFLVRGRREFIVKQIARSRSNLADNAAELSFMPNISKYVIEIALVIGGLSIAFVQFSSTNASRAIATLVIFLAAGTRIAPAVLRIQQGALLIRSSLGSATPTLVLYESLNCYKTMENADTEVISLDKKFEPSVSVQDIDFKYPNSEKFALHKVSLDIAPGEFIAFTGKSGSGKSTLADLLVGAITTSTGRILVSGQEPGDVHKLWPGRVAYVPQFIYLIDATISENVALGYPKDEINENDVLNALQSAELLDFVTSLPRGLDTHIGERGTKLSGGQRQRLGIARALYTDPRLIIFDESTSSLDVETEGLITETLRKFRGDRTLIVIAHRLSTIVEADRVYIFESGKLVDFGKYHELSKRHELLSYFEGLP